jgi:hypothetical protein
VQPGKSVAGFATTIAPNGVIYQAGGEIIQQTAGKPLTLYQQRPFLFPRVYNSGCVGPYCTNRSICPCSVPDVTCAPTNALFDNVFRSDDPFTTGAIPLACVPYRGCGC